MTMTPLAPRSPYIAVSVGSFSTWIDAMSFGLMPVRLPPGPGSIGMPSITYSGWLLPVNDEPPRMRTAMPPSGARVTSTPGNRPSKIFSMGWPGLRSMSSEVTVRAPGGLVGFVLLEWAQPQSNAIARTTDGRARDENEVMGVPRERAQFATEYTPNGATRPLGGVRHAARVPCLRPGSDPRRLSGWPERGDGRSPRWEARLQPRARRSGDPLAFPTRLRVPGRPAARRWPANARYGQADGRRDLDAAMGRGSPGEGSPQRVAGRRRRDGVARTTLYGHLPGLQRRHRLPLRVPRAAGTGRLRHYRRAHRVRPGGRCPRLVDPVEPAAARSLRDAVLVLPRERDRQRANAAHNGNPRRPHLHRHPRGEPGGLRQDEPARRGHGESHAPCGARADGGRDQGAGTHTIRDAVAHHPAGGPGGRSGSIGARPESQPAQRAAEHGLDQADEVRRHLVGHAHRHHDLELGTETRRHDGEHETLYRF